MLYSIVEFYIFLIDFKIICKYQRDSQRNFKNTSLDYSNPHIDEEKMETWKYEVNTIELTSRKHFSIFLNVSTYGGFLKWRYPRNHPFTDGFSIINHPKIMGYPHDELATLQIMEIPINTWRKKWNSLFLWMI